MTCRRRRRLLRRTAGLLATLLALGLMLPVITILFRLLRFDAGPTWTHLTATVVPESASNSIGLALGVGVGVALVGVATAWLTALYEFPGRRLFDWALILPLAMPAYVMAYAYTDLLQYVGPVQSALRQHFGWSAGDYWFPDIRSLPGAILMFVCVLYPYVYLLVRTQFLERAARMQEAARMLGLTPRQAFWRVSLPLARPAIAAGVTLALMETLADYGTVAYFALPTFTTGIYRAWFSLGDRQVAAQLAGLLLLGIMALLALEKAARGRARYDPPDVHGRRRERLRGGRATGALVICLMPVTLGFLVPAGLLLHRILTDDDARLGSAFPMLATNSFVLGGLTALIAVALALLFCYHLRLVPSLAARLRNRVINLGYAVPGAVIAVGILIPLTRLDHALGALWQALTGQAPGLILTGGIAGLIYAYLVRYMAAAMQGVESALLRITPSMDEAARTLGAGPWRTLHSVHMPMLRGSLLTAGLLVFVDVMKELPATLVLRPFNFETLATQTYRLASDERLAEASPTALAIVAVGLLPLLIISWQIARGRPAPAT